LKQKKGLRIDRVGEATFVLVGGVTSLTARVSLLGRFSGIQNLIPSVV